MGPHDEFLELCAVSTSGDLTEEEQSKLQEHLAGCSDCRRALKEFQAAVDLGVPLLASKLSTCLPNFLNLLQRIKVDRIIIAKHDFGGVQPRSWVPGL